MNQLVIGLGEVGQALMQVLQCEGHDKTPLPARRFNVLHICYPWNPQFIGQTRAYKQRYQADLVIVHSTVPVGTCRLLDAVHSPVRGKHPHLASSLWTFVKFFGGKQAEEAANIFQKIGIRTHVTELAETTEAMKLWDTAQYGLMIMIEKEIHDYCEEHHLDFETVYTLANETYNQGYAVLNMPNFRRPVLKHVEGKIGGHCVVFNATLLNSPSAVRLRDA